MPRVKKAHHWFQQALEVGSRPTSSEWLKRALNEAVNQDPVPIAAEAETLWRILQLRAEEAHHGVTATQSLPAAKA